jgi:hypothetical protein
MSDVEEVAESEVINNAGRGLDIDFGVVSSAGESAELVALARS